MDWNLFIIPLTLISVELIKITRINTRWLPFLAVALGAIFGAVYALAYSGDLLTQIVSGIIFGASASGIYDAAKSVPGDAEQTQWPEKLE